MLEKDDTLLGSVKHLKKVKGKKKKTYHKGGKKDFSLSSLGNEVRRKTALK